MNSAAASDLPYLDAFATPSHETWRAAVDKVLKGGDFEKRLVNVRSPFRNGQPAFEQKPTDLIDHCGSPHYPAFPHPMNRL